jgi:transposase
VYGVQDWAEVHRLFHREGLSKSAIARRLGMSRTTVIGLLARDGPPRYVRAPAGSTLDPHRDESRRMLADDPDVAATVVLDRIRRSGFAGQITIVRDFMAKVRPEFARAAAFQRTSYLPGEIGQVDWWHTGIRLDVGRGSRREAVRCVLRTRP